VEKPRSTGFYVNDKYWSGDGAPIFSYIGGPYDCT
jgi:hypothetical protein